MCSAAAEFMLRLATDPNMVCARQFPPPETSRCPACKHSLFYHIHGATDFSGPLETRRGPSAVWNEAGALVALGFTNNNLSRPEATAGFAPDDTPSAQHYADSCTTRPQELSLNAKTTGALDDSLMNATAAA